MFPSVFSSPQRPSVVFSLLLGVIVVIHSLLGLSGLTMSASAPKDCRLPNNTRPSNYALALVPDLATFTFTGPEIVRFVRGRAAGG